jgi:hypothetical protein
MGRAPILEARAGFATFKRAFSALKEDTEEDESF